ncbi:MAG: LysR family transcriptional regulator [Zoogloeaceae bacterium]|uniref:LysR family transcriptional regulator n=1 Tax=Denitromonas sp. TaxID=2734609 RepID=UPI001E172328|nr:LysR family transcriptional regulator [Rhodocyclaceae bacterium]MCP5220877.1 LysR family transcriptional regulator [Zoogloeaceae bacterium]
MKPRALLNNLAEADLRLLRVFIAIAESGGLAAAELRLNISRSVISRHLKALESRLAVRLCDRGRAGFALTEEGTTVLAAARRLLAQIDAFRTEIGELHEGLRGELNLAVFDKFVTNPGCKLPAAIAAFDAVAPSVRINLHVAHSGEIEPGLLDGRFQLGIQPMHRASDSFEAVWLFGEPMQLYCAASHPLVAGGRTPDDAEIRAARLVGLGYHSPNMETFWRLGLQPVARAFDQEATVALILSGCYVGFLPAHYAQCFVADGTLCCIGAQVFHYHCDWHAFVPRNPAPSRLARRFLEILCACHDTGSVSDGAPAFVRPH